MKFSEQWLREWVNPHVGTDELAEQLTMAGLEVEALEPVAAEFDGVVVGRVIAVAPHPDADKLRVCQVDAGEAQPLQIVCGAPNVYDGMFAPLARIGAYLPDDLRIKRAKLRGIESEGMLCSAKELGLSEQAEGLMELPPDAQPGVSVRTYLGLEDFSIELSLTPNRSDCLGVAGVAREVGVLNRCRVSGPAMEPVEAAIADTFPVQVQAAGDCPRYVGRVVRGINPDATSPVWMQERLRRSGLRSLDPVVDVTNYVLLELGQPMHAFDLDTLSKEIVVRHASGAETLTLLDGTELRLEAGTLIIADQSGPLAMAGIMGGADSGVGENTRDLFLESAFFAPTAISGRARSYGLHTDSSHRFERGVDPQLQRVAMERATGLLLDIVGGEAGPVIEVVNEGKLPKRPPVTLRAERITRTLGAGLPAEEVTDCLVRLGMEVEQDGQTWQVTPPSFRFDIEIEEDLIEEVGRVYGYSRLPTRRPLAHLDMAARPEAALSARRLRAALVDRGYQEAISYSFVDPRLQERLDPGKSPVELANPLSAEMSVMRTRLLPGLVQAAVRNQRRQQERIRLFELGVTFLKQDGNIVEKAAIAGIATGPVLPEHWDSGGQHLDFYDIKGDVEALLALTQTASRTIFKPTTDKALHPGQAADIWKNNQLVGRAGAIHPEVARELGLAGETFVFELDLESLGEGEIPAFRELSKFPSIRRDIAVTVDEAIESQALCDVIADAAGGLLTNLQLFDVYTGKGIDLGRKSLALGLTLRDSSRTLIEEDVDAVMTRVIAALHEKLDATLRD